MNKTRAFLVAVLVALMLIATVAPVAAAKVEPVVIDPLNRDPCGDLGYTGPSLKIEGPHTGVYWGNRIKVKIRVYDHGQMLLFRSKTGYRFNAVIVKGGQQAHLYLYDPAVNYDRGPTAPPNPNSGKFYGISYVAFCDP